MSGVALDVPVGPARPAFVRVLWRVLLGFVGALISLVLAAILLLYPWEYPRPWVRPGPFPIDGAWSLAADIVVAALVVLVMAWWIRRMVESAAKGHVSLAVVALAVAVTGYVPSLLLPPGLFLLWDIVSLLATTWIVRRYAIGKALPFSKLSGRVCVALGLVGVAILGSYRVYHPLVTTGLPVSADFNLENSDWADMTILSVDGGSVGTAEGRIHRLKLPYTLHGREGIGVYSSGRPCVRHHIVIRYSVLGLTSTQRFTMTRDAPGNGAFVDIPDGAGCGANP
jgi:hypothetical protein